MTDKTPIRALIEAVEAGSFPGDSVLALPDQRTTDLFYAANRGSLDAALALHEALLPGWLWGIVMHRTDFYGAGVGEIEREQVIAVSTNPARALLLAILRAYEAQTGGGE